MVATYNDLLFEAMVRHQVGLLLYSAGVRNKVWALLDATEADLRHQIEDRLRNEVGKAATPARLVRMQKLLAALGETRLSAWKEVKLTWFEELRALALAEPRFTAGIMESVLPVQLGLVVPDAAKLKAIVTSQPFMGDTLKGWADGIAKADVLRIQQQVRIGLVQGEAVPDIARRIVGTVSLKGANGVTQIARSAAANLTRTATNAIANEARAEFLKANAGLLTGDLFTATLDSRTTPICRSLDGNVYATGEGPKLPLHWGERSIYSPIVDGEVIGDRPRRDFTQRQLLREFAEREGFDAPTKRDNLPKGTKGAFDAWARGRMRELTGTAPAKLTYAQWFKGQSAAFQDDILGPARGKLYRQGKLTLDKFVAPDGRTLTLAELAQFNRDAFRAAGLDPADFKLN